MMLRMLYRLIGLLLGLSLIACAPQQVVMRKWYEPQVDVLNKRSTPALLLRETHTVDDADYCLLVLKLKGNVSASDTTTLFLPYEKWETINRGDTVRLNRKKYSDWNIKN